MADNTEVEEPKWQTIELSKLLEETEVFRDFKDSLESVKDTLEKAVDFLDALEVLLNILSRFENIIDDFFNGFLGAFLEEIKQIIKEAKSTGVYALDLTSHNFIGNKFIKTGISDSNDPVIRDYIANEFTFPYWESRVNNTRTKKELNIADTWWTRWMGIYKRQTYREWMRVATDAFFDENDKADPALSSLYLSKLRSGATVQKSANAQKSDFFMIPQNALKYIRPGRPDFGPRGYMQCYVVAFTAPDFLGFLQLISLFSYFLGGAFGRQKEYMNKFIDDMKKDTKGIGDDYRDILNALQKNLSPSVSRGTPPDFIGVSAYQLLPELFDGLDRLIEALQALFKKTSSGLAQYIKDIIEFIRKEIQEIRMFIQLIQEIIDFIERLLEFNGALLKVEGYGNAEIVEKMNAANDFPVPPDDKIYIGGGLFCFGFPTDKDNPGSFNLGQFWKDGYKRFEEKVQTYGRETDAATDDSDFDYIKTLFNKIT